MIENKKYIIFDIDRSAKDSLFLADLKAYGYKIAHVFDELPVDEEPFSKAEEVHNLLNQLFHYKGHRKAQVVLVSDKVETIEAAKELELDTVAVSFGEQALGEMDATGADYIATSQEELRALLINEAELQAKRAAAAMPKDGPTSTYVAKKDDKKRPNAMAVAWKFLYPFLLFYFVKGFLAELSFLIIGFLANGSTTIHEFVLEKVQDREEWSLTGDGNALILILTMAALFGVVYYFINGKECLKKASKEKGAFGLKDGIIWTMLCLVLALGLNSFFIGTALTKSDAAYQQTETIIYAVGIPLGILLHGVLVPLTEELLFRGVIFTEVKGLTKPLTAAVISSVLFGLYHGNLTQGIFAFMIGMVFAYAYHYSGRFIVPVLMHGIINITVFLLGKFECFKENIALAIIGAVCAVLSAVVLFFLAKNKETKSTDADVLD